MRKLIVAAGIACSLFGAGSFFASAARADGAIRTDAGFTTSSLAANDDGSTAPVDLGFTIDFAGADRSQVYVNNNGNVTFDAADGSYPPNEITQPSLQVFYGDVDTRDSLSGIVTYGTSTIDGHPAFGVNWPDVGYFNTRSDKLNAFQLVIIDRSDVSAGAFDVEYNYGAIAWDQADDACDGGACNTAPFVGYRDASTAFYRAGSATAGTFLDTGTSPLITATRNSSTPGRLAYSFRQGREAPDHIVLTPADATIQAGGMQFYDVEAFNNDGADLGDYTELATFAIAPDGTCPYENDCGAETAGAHTVTATVGAASADTGLTVTPAALDHIQINPSSAEIQSGGSQTYSAEGFDQYGNSRGDVTDTTSFSIAPDGACDGNNCGATIPGVHTVTGTHDLSESTTSSDAGLTVLEPAGGSASSTVTSDSASTMTDANTGEQITAIPSNDIHDVVVTTNPSCDPGSPSDVTLLFNNATYAMSANGDGTFSATIPAAQVTNGELTVIWHCGTSVFEDPAGRIELYDPSGAIDRIVGLGGSNQGHASSSQSAPDPQPVKRGLAGAQVTLFQVASYRPSTGPGDNGPGTCQTAATNPNGDYTTKPPADPQLSVRVDPHGGTIAPAVNPFIANPLGVYGWFTSTGCYYIVVHKDGYVDQTSPLVGVPPALLNLNITLDSTLTVAVTTASDPVTSATQTSTSAGGTTRPDATVAVTATDGTTTTPPAAATVDTAGNWTVSGIDVHTLNDGTITYRAIATDPDDNARAAIKTALKDTTPPTQSITITDTDNDHIITDAEATNGIVVNWAVAEAGPNVTVSARNAAQTAPAACATTGQPRTGSLTLPAACVNALADGTIEAVVSGADALGNTGQGVASITLKRSPGDVGMVVLAGENDPGTGHVNPVANAADTNDGHALRVRFDIASPGTITASSRITGGGGHAASAGPVTIDQNSSPDARTLTTDVSAFPDGQITVIGSVTDALGNHSSFTKTFTLDLHAPTTTWGTAEGATFVTVRAPVAGPLLSTVTLAGSSKDSPPVSALQFVVIKGTSDNGETISRTAVLQSPGSAESAWSLDIPLGPGNWTLTAQAQDEAGNLEAAANTLHVQVLGAL